MTTSQHIVHYWRSSLLDAERMAFSSDKLTTAHKVSLAGVATGQIGGKVAAAIYKELLSASGPVAARGSQGSSASVEVLICPLIARPVASRRSTGTGSNDAVTPLWVPAVLTQGGELVPNPTAVPWIARNVLEPVDHPSAILASVDDLDRFVAAHIPPSDESIWSEVWSYACTMLQHVTGMSLETFQLDGYEVVRDTAYMIVADSVQGSARYILRLYDTLTQGRPLPALLSRYAAPTEVRNRALLDGQRLWKTAALHTGQMRSKFAISPSQREALHHLLALADGEILAVNGPPGTGKTTLIQSVVASLWVNAALQGGEPPVILAASTNNQAVTNIIQSFAVRPEPGEHVVPRWIPGVESFGLYCVAKHKLADATTNGYQAITLGSERQETGFFAALETPAEHQAATTAFLDQCSRFFGRRVPDVEQAAELLRSRLVDIAGQIKRGMTLWGALTEAQRTMLERYGPHGGIDAYVEMRQQEYDLAQAELRRIKEVQDDWQKRAKRFGWIWPFSLLPASRRRVEQRNREFFAAANLPLDLLEHTNEAIISCLRARWEERGASGRAATEAVKSAGEDRQRLEQARIAWEAWCSTNGIPASALNVIERLDTTLRFQAFELATHYWEARWLSEVRQQLMGRREDPNLRSSHEQRWRRYAKLTPCFVSTLYMAPAFFSAFENRKPVPLFEYIDLLIIDEAGQVSPDVAGATFSLAKRSLVVGDILQIEPVWSITEGVDAGNMRRSGVASTPKQRDEFASTGLSAAAGSAMLVAQRGCAYQKYERERGLFLSEHRRCVPEIIAYCNELAYQGRLEPKRDSKAERILPAMGYAHVEGTSRRVQGSWENPTEAESIARWVAENRRALESHYRGRLVAEIVGIVTPFVRQAQRIREALQQLGITGVTVGTVHTLQGAERPVTIFSSVYHEPGSFFFDRNPNMLNVAVSRAQDSFLVFGNMPIFEPYPKRGAHRGSPSSMLARHLFAHPDNELPISARWRHEIPRRVQTRLIGSLADHRQILVEALQRARHRVVIVSPQLSEHAVRADRVDMLIKEAVNRGVSVEIYTDSQLDIVRDSGQLKPITLAARRMLPQSGAQLHVINRIHNKTLCVDDDLIVIGSFNWLSASRNETNPYQRHEESFCCEGPGVEEMIARVLQEMESRLHGRPNEAQEIARS
jgi:hypothetical protein